MQKICRILTFLNISHFPKIFKLISLSTLIRINRKRKCLTQSRKDAKKKYLHETQCLYRSKKLNGYSFFGNPLYHGLAGRCKNFLVLFAQNSIGNCLIPQSMQKALFTWPSILVTEITYLLQVCNSWVTYNLFLLSS